MTVFFCSTCGKTVPQRSLDSGTAIKDISGQVYCFKCVSSRAVNVSDSAVFRALSAKMAEGPIRGTVKRMSERLVTQMPDGRVKRFVKRVSNRLFVPRTAQYRSVAGSSPRNRLPPTTIAVVASVTKRRTEARNLALAAVACVVLAIGTIIVFLGAGKWAKSESGRSERAPAAVQAAAPSALEPTQQQAASTTTPVPLPPAGSVTTPEQTPPQKPGAAPVHATAAPATKTPLVIPPLLTEREAGPVSSKDFRADLASDRLDEARRLQQEKPADLEGYRRKLTEIVNAYPKTPAAEAAEALLARARAPEPEAVQPAKPSGPLGWLADWQVENLEKQAKARMREDFDAHRFVLETYPPAPGQALRLTHKARVATDRPFWEIAVRGAEAGTFDFQLEAAGKWTAATTVRGAEWRTFCADLTASAGQEIVLTLHHTAKGEQGCSAYWHAPAFVSQPNQAAALLSWRDSSTPRLADPKIQYESTLFGIYGALAESGADAALERIEKAKTDPVLTPLRARLEGDAACAGVLKEADDAALKGAASLVDNRPFTFVKTDGRRIAAGRGAPHAVTVVSGKTITLESKSEAAKAVLKLAYSDLAPQTRYELVKLGTPSGELADLRVGSLKLVQFSSGKHAELGKEICAHLETARKDAKMRGVADHLLAHYEFFRRDFEAQQRFEALDNLCQQKKWREAQQALSQFKTEYLNSYALDRLSGALERWSAIVEKETASPILKR